MRKQVAQFAAILSGLIFFVTASVAADYYVYVACESQDQVDVVRFDGEKAVIDKSIPVGEWPVENEGPHGITVSPDGEHWFLSMAHGKPFGYVYKFKTGTDELLGRVELGLFPATMQMSKSTGLLYVVNFNLHGDHIPSSVSVVEPEMMEELERIETGVMPHGSRLSPDGMKHYSMAMMSGELFEIDAASLTVSRKLYVGKEDMSMAGHEHHNMPHSMKNGKPGGDHNMPPEKPTWVFPHPNEPFVYVANNGVDEVVEVDLNAWKVTRRFETDKGPYNVEISPDGKFMVVTYKSAGRTGIWDLKKGKELANLENSRKVTHGVVISPDSRYAFVTVEGIGGEPGSCDIFDLKKKKLVTTADTGKQAGGVAFWKMDN
mgnify:CR=1 FL=1